MAVRVCETKDVPPGEARRYSLDGREVAVVNLGDEGFRALDAICSHAKYYLDEGEVDVDLETIECPKHGSTFDLNTGSAKTRSGPKRAKRPRIALRPLPAVTSNRRSPPPVH